VAEGGENLLTAEEIVSVLDWLGFNVVGDLSPEEERELLAEAYLSRHGEKPSVEQLDVLMKRLPEIRAAPFLYEHFAEYDEDDEDCVFSDCTCDVRNEQEVDLDDEEEFHYDTADSVEEAVDQDDDEQEFDQETNDSGEFEYDIVNPKHNTEKHGGDFPTAEQITSILDKFGFNAVGELTAEEERELLVEVYLNEHGEKPSAEQLVKLLEIIPRIKAAQFLYEDFPENDEEDEDWVPSDVPVDGVNKADCDLDEEEEFDYEAEYRDEEAVNLDDSEEFDFETESSDEDELDKEKSPVYSTMNPNTTENGKFFLTAEHITSVVDRLGFNVVRDLTAEEERELVVEAYLNEHGEKPSVVQLDKLMEILPRVKGATFLCGDFSEDKEGDDFVPLNGVVDVGDEEEVNLDDVKEFDYDTEDSYDGAVDLEDNEEFEYDAGYNDKDDDESGSAKMRSLVNTHSVEHRKDFLRAEQITSVLDLLGFNLFGDLSVEEERELLTEAVFSVHGEKPSGEKLNMLMNILPRVKVAPFLYENFSENDEEDEDWVPSDLGDVVHEEEVNLDDEEEFDYEAEDSDEQVVYLDNMEEFDYEAEDTDEDETYSWEVTNYPTFAEDVTKPGVDFLTVEQVKSVLDNLGFSVLGDLSAEEERELLAEAYFNEHGKEPSVDQLDKLMKILPRVKSAPFLYEDFAENSEENEDWMPSDSTDDVINEEVDLDEEEEFDYEAEDSYELATDLDDEEEFDYEAEDSDVDEPDSYSAIMHPTENKSMTKHGENFPTAEHIMFILDHLGFNVVGDLTAEKEQELLADAYVTEHGKYPTVEQIGKLMEILPRIKAAPFLFEIFPENDDEDEDWVLSDVDEEECSINTEDQDTLLSDRHDTSDADTLPCHTKLSDKKKSEDSQCNDCDTRNCDK